MQVFTQHSWIIDSLIDQSWNNVQPILRMISNFLFFFLQILLGVCHIDTVCAYSQWNQKELQYLVCILHTLCNFTHIV